MKKFAPSEEFSSGIRYFEVVETTLGMTRWLLPDTGFVVAFRFAGSATLLEGAVRQPMPNCAVTGLRGTARRMLTSPHGGLIVAKLREACAGRFLAAPLHELYGQTRSLDQVLSPGEVARTSFRIARAEGDAERVAILEQFFRRIARPWQPDAVVLGAVRAIDAASGSVRVSELARAAAISQDALEKRFRRAVGATPKQYASIVRLRHAIRSYVPGSSLTRVSLEAGFCDQSHFIRQFRQVTGVPPREFLAAAKYC
jgi:AraC-like DNA-binding protein